VALEKPPCWANGAALIAPTESGLEQAKRIWLSGDRVAMRALLDQGRAAWLPTWQPFYVADWPWIIKRSSGPVAVRVPGQPDTVWTDWQFLGCEDNSDPLKGLKRR
jgi:hypothetical protein